MATGVGIIEWVLAGGYLVQGPAVWGVYALGLHTGLKRLNVLDRAGSSSCGVATHPPRYPGVLAVIPARNESANIEACVRSVLGQRGVELRLLVIDDASTDDTGAILDGLAENEPRLRVLHLPAGMGGVPAGWTGKNWALHRGLRAAGVTREAAGGASEGREGGEGGVPTYLLFIDSDVVLEAGAVESAVRLAVRGRDGDDPRGHALVSLLPRQELRSMVERALVPLMAAATMAAFSAAYTNNDHLPRAAFACGQFMLLRTETYFAMGGHEAVRDQLSEDVAIARKVKAMGGRPRVAEASRYGRVLQHAGTAALLRQWARNYYGDPVNRYLRIGLTLDVLLPGMLGVVPAMGWGVYRVMFPAGAGFNPGPMWLMMAGVHLGLMMWLLHWTYRTQGLKGRLGLGAVLGVPLMVAVVGMSAWYCVTGRVTWRGRSVAQGVTAGAEATGRAGEVEEPAGGVETTPVARG